MAKKIFWWPVLSGVGIGGVVLYLNGTKRGRNNVQSAHGGIFGLMSQGMNQSGGSIKSNNNNRRNSSAAAASVAQGR